MKKLYVKASCELLLLKSEDIMFLTLSNDYGDSDVKNANIIQWEF